MDRQERLNHIIRLLQDLTLSSMDIKARFPGVTPRTIERDLEQLAQEGRIHQIRPDRSRNPTWETCERAPTIEVRWMNGRTAAAIKLMEQCLAFILPTYVLQDLHPLFDRAEAALKHTHNREYASWVHKIRIWPAVREKNDGNPMIANIGTLQEALLKGKTVHITRGLPASDASHERIHPQGLVFSRAGVHLLATTDLHQSTIQINLHDIIHVSVDEKPAITPSTFDLEELIQSPIDASPSPVTAA
jgi:predicted DNA-binding transcriptional regulator YafY